MARADRLERLDVNRIHNEADYRAILVAALTRCDEGTWGLFGHNDDRWTRAAFADELKELETLGEQIDAMRETLFMEPYVLHREFFASRGPAAKNAVGEPKQARAWLVRLASEAAASRD